MSSANTLEKEKTTEKNTGTANLVIIVFSVVFIILSALMIFVKEITTEYLCYGVCAAGVIAGIAMIIRYFMTDAFKNVNAYGFSLGVLFIILSICGLLRVSMMAAAIITILGVILLLSGVIILQHSLDLRRLKDVLWIPVIIISVLVLGCSVAVIIQAFAEKIPYENVVWWMILVVAVLNLIINIYTTVKVSLFTKKERKTVEELESTDSEEDKTKEQEETVEEESVIDGEV